MKPAFVLIHAEFELTERMVQTYFSKSLLWLDVNYHLFKQFSHFRKCSSAQEWKKKDLTENRNLV